MRIKDISSTKGQLIHAVIETPRGTAYKYDYDFEFDQFRMNKILPLGIFFPFDFGIHSVYEGRGRRSPGCFIVDG